MKLKFEIIPDIVEDEIIIKCKKLTPEINDIQQYISNLTNYSNKIVFFKENEEYYFSLDKIVFFETEQDKIYAHTINDSFQIKFRLYELEKILPYEFVRCSKSTIVNTKYIFSIQRNITASSLIRFHNTHKQLYVSRSYYKNLKFILDGGKII